MAENETVKANGYDGDAAAHHAIELAQKAGKEIDDALATIADAKQEMAGGPLRVMIALRNKFGDELDSMPRPGEKEGNNRDVITVTETINGETKSRNTTFYTVFADNLKVGKAIVQRLEYCERAKRTDTVKDDIPEDILEMARTNTLKRHIDYLTGRRGTFRQSIKKAMELAFQFNAVNSVPHIQAEPIWEDGKEGVDIIASPRCIQVWQVAGKDANGNALPIKYSVDCTVGTFLKFDANKAIEKGGGFRALEDTLQRGAKKGKAEGGTSPDRRIASLDTMVGVTVELHRYVDEICLDRDQANYDKLIKALSSGKATDEIVSAFVELRNYLDDIVKAAKLQDRYNKIQQQDKAA